MTNQRVRIGFPFCIGGGGPTLFLRRLRTSISSQRLAHVSYFVDPFNDINIFSNRTRDIYGKPYVFRVDGIHFDKGQPNEINYLKNKPIFHGIDRALGICFQSCFSFALIKNFYREIVKPYKIIHNGVDTVFFSPEGPNKRDYLGINEEEVVFVTSAKWRVHKRLIDVINIFIKYEQQSSAKCHLLILGRNDLPNLSHLRIYNIGFVPARELPSWYRAGNIFLFLSWLDNCPNTVIEAIACGLPVICTNQGGTRELVEITKGGIVVEADAEFDFKPVDLYNPPQPDYDKIITAIDEMVVNYDSYVQHIDRTMINIDNVARKYVKFVQKVLRYVAC